MGIDICKESQHFKISCCYNPVYINILQTILTGDCNAHSTLWRYNDTNQTGRTFEDIMNSTLMEVVYNKKNTAAVIHYSGTGTNPNILLVFSNT